jgi:hypothetical protein
VENGQGGGGGQTGSSRSWWRSVGAVRDGGAPGETGEAGMAGDDGEAAAPSETNKVACRVRPTRRAWRATMVRQWHQARPTRQVCRVRPVRRRWHGTGARIETKTHKCFNPVQKREIGNERFPNPPILPTNISGPYPISPTTIYSSVTWPNRRIYGADQSQPRRPIYSSVQSPNRQI